MGRAPGKSVEGPRKGAAAPDPGPVPGGGGSPPQLARGGRLLLDAPALDPPRPERLEGSLHSRSFFFFEILSQKSGQEC